jgi:hypothetical protein
MNALWLQLQQHKQECIGSVARVLCGSSSSCNSVQDRCGNILWAITMQVSY